MRELIVAVVTPFKDNKFDEDSFINILSYLDKDSDGILILGSTAEARLLNKEEKQKVCELALKYYPKKILVGIEGGSTQEVIDECNWYEGKDIYAFLISPISYIKPTQNGIIHYYMEIADKVSKPVIIYEIGKRCGVNIEIDTIKILKNHHNIIGIKDASGSEKYTMELAKLVDKDFFCYGGDDGRILTSLLYRGKGIISVFANKYPKVVRDIMDTFPDSSLFLQFKDLIDSVFIETSPLPIKYMLGGMESRKELGVLSQNSKDRIQYLIESYEKTVR